MNLSLWTPSPLILHIPTTKLTQDIFYSPNALFVMFLVLSNGRIHLKKRPFPFLMPPKHLITMTIEWHGFEHFFIILKPILGFLISMTMALCNSPFGSIIGGHDSIVPQLYYQLQQKKVATSGKRILLLKLTEKKFNSSVRSILRGFFVGNTDF